MPFDDLTDRQYKLVVTLVEKLESGNYDPEVWADITHDRPWTITLTSSSGAPSAKVGDFSETDLHALERENYLKFCNLV
jgi:hypothetical protein